MSFAGVWGELNTISFTAESLSTYKIFMPTEKSRD